MAIQIDQALCIRQWDWSETSQTVALFTRRHGVVRALAKGSRRPRSPFSGGIELLTTAEIGIILRPHTGLALLTSWDVHDLFPALRRVLPAYHAAMYIAELLIQFVRDHDPHPRLFDASVRTLREMDSAEAVPGLLLGFQWALLVECGFRPELDRDVHTGEPLPEAREYLFDPAAGGVSREVPGGKPRGDDAAGGPWRVRHQTVSALRAVARADDAGAVPAPIADRAGRLLASYLRHLLGYQTPAMRAFYGDRLAR